MKRSYKPGQTVFDNIEDFSAWDRCITRGMPVSMEPRNYNNGIRIMQSPGYVMILVEMAHEVRVVPIGMPPLPSEIKEWLGESRGHWEGNTLVVDVTNFGDKGDNKIMAMGSFMGGGKTMHLVERFIPVGKDRIDYQATIEDPAKFSRPWTVSIPTVRDDNYRIFEYACHEGNYAIQHILSGARAAEQAANHSTH